MKFRLANREDDQRIRALMRETVVPGHIQMIYSREPNFFDSLQTVDGAHQVIVAERSGCIKGMGIRSKRRLYVNEKATPLGYLSGLKLAPDARNLNVLAKGYAFLKQLHSAGKVPAYLSLIIKGNDHARKVLTSGKCGLPDYEPFGTYFTHIFPLKKNKTQIRMKSDQLSAPGTSFSPKELLEFMKRSSKQRQFFPSCEKGADAETILTAIGLNNVVVAQDGSGISGMMAVWDQTKFKQHVVRDYSPSFRTFRPFLNLALRVSGRHPLPAPGTNLRYGTAALICVKNDNHAVFKTILRSALKLAESKGLHYLALGAHERDPLRKPLENFFKISYRSELYIVSWENIEFKQALDRSLPPYLELGAL